MKTWWPAGPKIFFWKSSTDYIVTVLHVLQVMRMRSVRTAHKFTRDFLFQYLFTLCDKLLRKGGGDAGLNFQKKILGPAGRPSFHLCHQNKYSGGQKLYLRINGFSFVKDNGLSLVYIFPKKKVTYLGGQVGDQAWKFGRHWVKAGRIGDLTGRNVEPWDGENVHVKTIICSDSQNKLVINHIKFPAGWKQWQFPSEKNCHIHCTCKHKNSCKSFLCK